MNSNTGQPRHSGHSGQHPATYTSIQYGGVTPQCMPIPAGPHMYGSSLIPTDPNVVKQFQLVHGRVLALNVVIGRHIRTATARVGMTVSDQEVFNMLIRASPPHFHLLCDVWARDFVGWLTRSNRCYVSVNADKRFCFTISANQCYHLGAMAVQWSPSYYAHGLDLSAYERVYTRAHFLAKQRAVHQSTVSAKSQPEQTVASPPKKRSSAAISGNNASTNTPPAKKPDLQATSLDAQKVLDLSGELGDAMEGALLWFLVHVWKPFLLPTEQAQVIQLSSAFHSDAENPELKDLVNRIANFAVNIVRHQHPSASQCKILEQVPAMYAIVVARAKQVVLGKITVPLSPIPKKTPLLAAYALTYGDQLANMNVARQSVPAKDRKNRTTFKVGMDMFMKNTKAYATVDAAIEALCACLENDMKNPVVGRKVLTLWPCTMCWYYGTVVAFDSSTKVVTVQYVDAERLPHVLTLGVNTGERMCTLVC